MRAAILPLCLLLAACAGGKLPGEQPAPQAANMAPAPAAAPSVAASPPPVRTAGSGGGARGGASTAAARAEVDPDAPNPGPDPVTQVRADCWMAVEHQKALRGIDQRITYVDKCVADHLKGMPKS
jgi:hypothetical protein